jgi:RNA polymerase sigma factor (sigma-70 family)
LEQNVYQYVKKKEVNLMMDTLTDPVEELYSLYSNDIVRFFAEHLADREAAWDLCHEVFVRLLITLASGTRLQYPQRWLMRVAKNLLIDTYRHRQITSETLLSVDSQELAMLASDAATFKTLLERKDMLRAIVETFQCLPEKYQRLLFWREIERLPLQEIALRTGTTEPVLSTELWRARKLLQKEYQQRRFKDFLPADEEIFGHLDDLIASISQLRRRSNCAISKRANGIILSASPPVGMPMSRVPTRPISRNASPGSSPGIATWLYSTREQARDTSRE